MKNILIGCFVVLNIIYSADAKTEGQNLPKKSNAEFVLQGINSYLIIGGIAAKNLFDSLNLKAEVIRDESGVGIHKIGKNYSCFAEPVDLRNPSLDNVKDHLCYVFVVDPKRGEIR